MAKKPKKRNHKPKKRNHIKKQDNSDDNKGYFVEKFDLEFEEFIQRPDGSTIYRRGRIRPSKRWISRKLIVTILIIAVATAVALLAPPEVAQKFFDLMSDIFDIL